MENKKVNIVFCMVLIFFLALTYVLIRDLNAKRANDYQDFAVAITKIVREKNDKIRELAQLVNAKQNENARLNNTLAETKNDLDTLTRKLAQPPEPLAAK